LKVFKRNQIGLFWSGGGASQVCLLGLVPFQGIWFSFGCMIGFKQGFRGLTLNYYGLFVGKIVKVKF
jgi:hypothetical protein